MMVSDRGSFVYEPLDQTEKSFRLLCLFPAGATEDSLKCSMWHESLEKDQLPTYETISYTWGDHKDQTFIELNGLCLLVPTSSAEALQGVRYPDEARVIWIDAVCINQIDDHERATQVGIMRDIYSNSGRNIVYLGWPDAATLPALQSVQAIIEEIREETDDLKLFESTLYHDNGDLRYSDTGLQCHVDVEALLHLYARPWFRYSIATDECWAELQLIVT